MAASAPTPHGTGFPAEGRCGYYVEKKKRFCRMVVAAGKRFCGEHAGAAEEENARKRILCPLDPKHTVYEDQLAKHLKKCNSREKPKPDFFIQDINAGLKDETEIPEQLVPISFLSEEQMENLIKKLRKASEGLNSTLKDQIMSHPALHDALNDPKNGDSATKHLKQQVDGKHRKKNSVFERLQIDIQHLCLNKIPLLSKEKLPVVGIGKHLCGVATDLALRCLVETYAASCEERNEEPLAKRVKNDKTEKEINTLAKEGNEKNIPEKWTPVAGIVIALCCHHRCDWRHYVGKEYFRALGLGAVEFHYFQRMSSWATCGMQKTSLEASNISTKRKDKQNDGSEEHDDGGYRITDDSTESLPGFLNVEEKKKIGHLCKLLIDQGRINYLQQKGFNPALQYYTDPLVSLENVLLTALPNHSSSPETTA
ncbi:tRNA:m(4)X modification enzyme TRM13 homolog isoform X3 [Orcinus orca]|uniref:tRNA:m(4)X modification enzyme TRM13 n=3 Tax=Odontoceti TaxID=9722 RepID=A0A4U1EW15_MONMO|nr:tRNA:m(4)X modification enzyme TRM13 homolog isoform X3 [Tursiops truncatus]XP_022439949.1 tRNA:m(4)X modification enzyme TRM13 homolog isoform X3 [Delphinapterus leucas]XP_026970266.1 tRNA:m(4)X modification enzyme TRM13 homolog isoform X3 [Lagenorhynchus obliquidens]XP_029083723.1 tRNA:m(4)X modification enzyme TRM13 homolog isoform X1 [Monodon monoceros]XP_033289607.1 tRNA:m(4)X modification enzyme TRM13 homolog isoform X3 [Orcinus orca]XP_059882198.1 tRNA:m(4)X modification enzyme TRM13